MPIDIYNFFELSNNFTPKPEAAFRQFQSKELKASFSWMDLLVEENAAAFTRLSPPLSGINGLVKNAQKFSLLLISVAHTRFID
ncbi:MULTISPECIES: hypothetical protein [unclassified Endozoicomonas]|uniref:hypothetical protein n=1 Tax=unclassified Endozoicomonas TaxID=2644528 RepID=UPI002148AED1|nr:MULTISPECIES: hypothetical protein [unclassified Endozoicomonas]